MAIYIAQLQSSSLLVEFIVQILISSRIRQLNCMKDYIEHSDYSNEEKEELKNNYEHWADVTLDGIKQRLRDSDKLHE